METGFLGEERSIFIDFLENFSFFYEKDRFKTSEEES